MPSCASHAASVVFARKPDGTWRFCQDYSGLTVITQRSVEPLPHVDQLVDETRGARFFTKLDLAMAYMQFRIREEDQYKTSFRVPGGQYEFRVGAFGLHGMSSVLMRFMHSIFGRDALSFALTGAGLPRAHARTVCVGVLRRHPHLLQDARGASGARADDAQDAAAPRVR